MKKKLQLKDLKVKSFVTELGKKASHQLKGQGGKVPTDITGASCVEDYISCNAWECLATKPGDQIDCSKILK
ncbi:pinensin family lanthipeptide [Luteibaculum oceani]|uniref:Uncharacterized protein n=1 Tax=Luteibaculum oceani TaxID=1294296 RepID=A0A5C6VIL4_9FLAO|nr:pinensin family lanthipeptide [Luteibaculum oceani]TXC85233.1 hypothetical protein FRX97_01010 [Luteibaculum oceani]